MLAAEGTVLVVAGGGVEGVDEAASWRCFSRAFAGS